MVGWKKIHKPGMTFSEFSQIFMELCRTKVQIVPPYGNVFSGVANCKIFYCGTLPTSVPFHAPRFFATLYYRSFGKRFRDLLMLLSFGKWILKCYKSQIQKRFILEFGSTTYNINIVFLKFKCSYLFYLKWVFISLLLR